MKDFQAHIFKGLDLDTDKRVVSNDMLTDGNDIEYMSLDAGKSMSIEPMKSSSIVYEVPDVVKQFQYDRCVFDDNLAFRFIFTTTGGTVIDINPATTPASYAAMQTDFQTYLTANYGTTYTASFSLLQGNYFIITLYETAGSTPIEYTLTYYLDFVKQVTYTVQDAIDATPLKPIAASTIQDTQFVFSIGTDANCQEIGIAKQTNGIWAYTTIIRTNKFDTWSESQVFDIRIENQANSFYGVYWANNEKPKVLYCPIDFSENCVLKYTTASYNTATSGMYSFDAIDQQTNLQLINNTMRVQFSSQLQGGGGILSGGWRYAIRCGLNGTGNVTEWSYLSNLIPVFKTSTQSPSASVRIQGDVAGEQTGKINILQVDGAKANVYNFIELAAIHYAGGATSASIVNRFNISTDSFTIQHTGTETNIQTLDVASLPQVEEVITKARSIEIKKNRLNLADNTVAVTDDDLQSVINSIELSSDREGLTCVGMLGDIGGGDVYALPIANTNYVGFDTIAFGNVIYDQLSQFTTATSTFTCVAPYTSTTIRSEINFSITGTPTSIQFVLFINGIPTNVSASISLVSGVDYSYDLGLLWGGVSNFIVATNAGDTISIGFYYLPTTGGDMLNIKKTSNVSYVNGESIGTSGQVGEYQEPENVANKLGYMINETYAFFVKCHFDNGYISKPILINNASNPLTFVYDNATKAPFTTNDTTNGREVYAYYGILNNIDVDALKDAGVVGLSVWRAVCNPTILGGGVAMTANTVIDRQFGSGYYAGIPVVNNEYFTTIDNSNNYRKYGFFVSPDIHISQPSYNDGDRLITMGVPYSYNNKTANGVIVKDINGIDLVCNGSYAEYLGASPMSAPSPYDIDDAQYVEFNSASGYDMGIESYIPSNVFGYFKAGHSANQALAFYLNSRLVSDGADDNGVQIAQYQRVTTNQYDLDSVTVVPTGTYIDIENETDSVLNDVQFWGGDTYTQKTITKIMYGSADVNDNSQTRYSFITYYGQNRVNTQLFYTDKEESSDTWNLSACSSINQYLFPTNVSDSNPEEQFNYDRGYIATNVINTDTPFDSSLQTNSHFGSRIWYSEQKPTGSVYDFFRKIKPFDFKDLDAKNGDICALFDINDVMVAVQPNAVSVLPYQSDVAISSTTGVDVYIGNGGVYAQRENIVSAYGSSIKTCVIRGQNTNGNYNLYWYSNLFKKFMRYGSGDGVKILSDANHTRSWFLNNTDQISAEWDLIMGYDSYRDSVFITSRAINKNIPQWSASTTYTLNQPVYYNEEGKTQTFENVPNIYYSSINPNLNNNPYDQDTAWDFQQTTNADLYNYWTLVFNEKINAFTTFATFMPYRYFNYMGRIICPRPLEAWGDVSEMFIGGTYLNFFNGQGGSFEFEVTTNKNGFQPKKSTATSLVVGSEHDTANNPDLTVYNDSQTSTTTAEQFELRRDNLAGSVRDDDNGHGIIGNWASYKFISTAFMRVLAVVNTFYTKYRTPFK